MATHFPYKEDNTGFDSLRDYQFRSLLHKLSVTTDVSLGMRLHLINTEDTPIYVSKVFKMKVAELLPPSSSDKGAVDMSYPNVYREKNRNYGARSKVRKEKVTVRDSKTGKIYGRRTIIQNET